MSLHDERINWKRIPEAAEKQAATGKCQCGCAPGRSRFQHTASTHYPFAFFDEEAFRFHLPAYLVAALDDAERAREMLQMVPLGPFGCKKSLLNAKQRGVVASCILQFVALGYMGDDIDG